MRILDIFSRLPERELNLEKIEEMVLSLESGEQNKDGYSLRKNLPENARWNEKGVTEELINDGRKVCYLIKDGEVIAVVGYK